MGCVFGEALLLTFFFCLGFLGFGFESEGKGKGEGEGEGGDFVIVDVVGIWGVIEGGAIIVRAGLTDEGSNKGSLAN